jgi:predicted tellurium resistance membrane protein TerC
LLECRSSFVYEIHNKLEATPEEKAADHGAGQLGSALAQIVVLDIIFSLDSVITAVGMAQQLWIMVVAVVLAVGVMLVFSGPISDFVYRHPTLQMLALSFLVLIGVMLVAEGIEKHIERGYIYFAMAFSLVVEMLNLRLRKQAAPVKPNLTGVPSP